MAEFFLHLGGRCMGTHFDNGNNKDEVCRAYFLAGMFHSGNYDFRDRVLWFGYEMSPTGSSTGGLVAS